MTLEELDELESVVRKGRVLLEQAEYARAMATTYWVAKKQESSAYYNQLESRLRKEFAELSVRVTIEEIPAPPAAG